MKTQYYIFGLYYGDLISIIETTLSRPNFRDLILWKLYYRNLIMETIYISWRPIYMYIKFGKTKLIPKRINLICKNNEFDQKTLYICGYVKFK